MIMTKFHTEDEEKIEFYSVLNTKIMRLCGKSVKLEKNYTE